MTIIEQIFHEGMKIADWACDSGPHFGVECNGGIEHLIKWKGKYYYLVSGWDNEVVYPETFGEVDVGEELENGGFIAEYIKKDIEEILSSILQNGLGHNDLFAFLRSRLVRTNNPILMLVNWESLPQNQKTAVILAHPPLSHRLKKGKLVFSTNEEIENPEDIAAVKYIKKACPRAVLFINNLSQLISLLQEMLS